MKNLPFISVVIPLKNEVRFIKKCIDSILEQNYPADKLEIIICDGGSTDGSIEVVKKFAETVPTIKILGGPGVNCPAGMNIGIREARGHLVSKVDAHGYVAPDFLEMNAKYMELYKDEGVKCAGGPILPLAETLIAKANVYARSCLFGVGGGVNNQSKEARFTDTVQCGTYRKDVFKEVGLFDESLQFGEDEEMNWRVVKAGYKIFSTPEVKFFYYPRDSFKKLYKQYSNYGFARVKVIRKHPDFLKIKHIAPSAFVVSLFVSGILAICDNLFVIPFLGIAGSYIIGSLLSSILISKKRGWVHFFVVPASFASLHFGYGLGFLKGTVEYFKERIWTLGKTTPSELVEKISKDSCKGR